MKSSNTSSVSGTADPISILLSSKEGSERKRNVGQLLTDSILDGEASRETVIKILNWTRENEKDGKEVINYRRDGDGMFPLYAGRIFRTMFIN